MKNSVILQVTNDEFELPVACFENTAEMARKFGIKEETCRCLIFASNKPKPRAKFKFIRVWLDKNE